MLYKIYYSSEVPRICLKKAKTYDCLNFLYSHGRIGVWVSPTLTLHGKGLCAYF